MSIAGKKGRVLWLYGGVQKIRHKSCLTPMKEGSRCSPMWQKSLCDQRQLDKFSTPTWSACLPELVVKAGKRYRTDSPCNQPPPPGCSGSLITPAPTQVAWLWGKDLAETILAIWGGITVVLSNFQFLPPAEAKNVPHCLEVSGSVAVGWEQPSEPLSYTLPWISQQITRS